MDIVLEAWPVIVLSLLGFSGLVGLLALFSPKMFAVVAETGGLWVTGPKTTLDAPIDIDQFVLKNSRQFGALVLMVVCYLTLFSLGRVDPTWTPLFLMFVVGVSVCFALSGLLELRGQVSKIENRLAEARIDGLTGLANRRAFDEELGRRLAEKSRKGGSFCVAMLDIDEFKQINDKHGHLTGDLVLTKSIAPMIRGATRTMDVAARYAGDEFAVIYPATNLAEASKAVENLRAAIESSPLPLEDEQLRVTVSIGVAEAAESDTVGSLVKRADDALYAAKRNGRNATYRHDGESCVQ
ncbi:MAG: GGDEF domain-containing protein [Pirellulaceae bacterium]